MIRARRKAIVMLSVVAACGKVEDNTAIDAPPGGADAPMADIDAGPDAPPPTKKVFISSLTFFADFGGTTQADTACQNMANGAGLPGVFRAWVSTPVDPVINRFVKSTVPYTLVDGTVIANDFVDLADGTLAHAINLTEAGNPLPDTGITQCHGTPTCAQTFTATRNDGSADTTNDQCLNWTTRIFQDANGNLNTFLGGDSLNSDSGWTVRASGFRCDFQARIYCFQQ